MNSYYIIFEDDLAIGEVTVRQEGAFIVLFCKCMPISKKPERLYLILDNNRCIDLGLCVPDGKEMTLVKRIRKKEWSSSDARFEIRKQETETKKNTNDIMAFDRIEDLPSIRLEKTEGQWSFSQAPSQPGSDPTP